jgi:hypothetical protein
MKKTLQTVVLVSIKSGSFHNRLHTAGMKTIFAFEHGDTIGIGAYDNEYELHQHHAVVISFLQWDT